MQHDNKGRGVVLIGHSQGSGMLTQLIKNEIDGKPIQAKVISALLLGTNVAVPKGKDVGGAFQNMPLCKSASQIGCVISYVSFRDDSPPPANSRFGRVPTEGMTAACVNPATLTEAMARYTRICPAAPTASVPPPPRPSPGSRRKRTSKRPSSASPACSPPSASPTTRAPISRSKYNGNPTDPRTDEIVGDVIANGQVMKDWGLHLIDAQRRHG